MLKLTVLLRYIEEERRTCDCIGEMIFDYQKGKLLNNKCTCGTTTGIFDTKYSYQKRMIYNLFTSKKSLEEIFKRIRKLGLKIQKVDLGNNDYVQVVILIDEALPSKKD